jgi:hypothetical protein
MEAKSRFSCKHMHQIQKCNYKTIKKKNDKTEGKYYNYNTLVHLEPSLVDTQNGSRFCLHKINIRNCSIPYDQGRKENPHLPRKFTTKKFVPQHQNRSS